LLKQSVGSLKGEKVKPRVEVQVRLDFLDMNVATGGKTGQASRLPSERDSASSDEKSRADSPSQNLVRRDACPTLRAALPHNYIPESQQRIEIYRKLAQATDKAALEALQKELRDRFGPVPPAVELLLAVGELKILASEKSVTVIEVKDDKIMLTRNNDFVTLGGKFPRLTKKESKARLKEIKKLLLAL
jgi:transcription-repair coupling factor (superfamily II helicase)